MTIYDKENGLMAVTRAGVRWTWNGQTYTGTLPNYYGAVDQDGQATGTENDIGTALGMNVSDPDADAPPAVGQFDTVSKAIASGTVVRAVIRYQDGTKIKTAKIVCPTDRVNQLAQLNGKSINFAEYGEGVQIGTIQRRTGTIRSAKVLTRTKVVY